MMNKIKELINLRIVLISCAFLWACEPAELEPINETPVIEENQPDGPIEEEDEDEDKNPIGSELEEIGQGSGNLIIKDVEGKKYSVKPGIYSSFHLENIKNTSIDGLEKVKIANGTIYISKVNGLSINGISLEDSNQPVINIYDEANDLTIKNVVIRNVSNNAIRFLVDKKYDGSAGSYSRNIHLINIKAENIGSLFGTRGEIKADGFYGLIKGFKLQNSSIINSPNLTNGIYVGCVEDYEISNNRVDNVNKSDKYPNGNNNHNGIFHMNGSGKIFRNKITNHQGNGVRAWLFSITSPNAVVEIHNNVVYNSTRYSAFELQVPPSMESLGTFKPANAKIYNNTVGKLNTGQPKYYEGRIVDIYQTYGSVEVYNNLFFSMRDNEVSLNQFNPNDTKLKESNNSYFKDAADAVDNLTNLRSKVAGIGASL